MRTVVVLVIVMSAQLASLAPAAVAQPAQTRDPGGAGAAAVAPETPPTRPATRGSSLDGVVGVRPDRASPLTDGQCTGIGGKVVSVRTTTCASARKCYVVDSEGVISGRCITVAG